METALAFDKLRYQKDKKLVIDKIKQTHNWEFDEGFVADGVICPDVYNEQHPKILIILAETYGYSDYGDYVDIETQLEDDFMGIKDSSVQTPRKIASLLWLLFESLSQKKQITKDKFTGIFRVNESNVIKLQETLSKIAWINIKKASKPIDENNKSTRLDYWDIYNSGKRNKKILELQLRSIAPNLIIACSDPVIHTLCDNNLLGESILRNVKYEIQINSNDQKIIFVTHPVYLEDWGYNGIYETFEILYNSLTSNP